MRAFFVSAPRPAHINHRAFQGGAIGNGRCDCLCGLIIPECWLTHPKERHDVWNLQKENPQSGSGN
ncbi:hypothetical protein DND13_27950 [Escherichia coli]|nr:hypothetical protein [Escherichia coli]EAC0113542.1 hypothetical protein [Escherichia coli]EEV9008711.1 hypothetical protein [Escherichia coli]EEV9926793.1 hypothetical protein [Escherichia coli]EEW1034576.1 hypothetical protein [Escherichia coli]